MFLLYYRYIIVMVASATLFDCIVLFLSSDVLYSLNYLVMYAILCTGRLTAQSVTKTHCFPPQATILALLLPPGDQNSIETRDKELAQ